METFEIRPLNDGDRDPVGRFLEDRWGSAKIVTRGRVHHGDWLPGFIAEQEDKLVGLTTYRMDGDECEIVTMDSVTEGMGIGTVC